MRHGHAWGQGYRWHPDEDRLLLELRQRRQPLALVAKQVRRSVASVKKRSQYLLREGRSLAYYHRRPGESSCPVCGEPFKPYRKGDGLTKTCSPHCGQSLALERRVAARLATLPEHDPEGIYCAQCREIQRFHTNLNGMLLVMCHCGERPVPLKQRDSFERYAATAERLAELGGKVQTEQTRIADTDKSRQKIVNHPWRNNQQEFGTVVE